MSSVVRETGDLLKSEFESRGNYDFSIKAKGEIVTKADKLAEERIIAAIKENHPEHSILSEESGMSGDEEGYVWIVDPLDGTTNFAMKVPFFNTTIALVKDGKIVLGFVYAPMFDEFYWAVDGEGAYLNDEKIAVNADSEAKSSLHAFCYGGEGKMAAADYYKKSLAEGYQVRQLGAAALELARIGSGILDSIIVPAANPWDVAAGALIVQEAGGVVTDLEGKEYGLKSKSGIIAAANEEVYQKMRGLL
jgi:myo-inositol-1(or 4)-monophosphatase